jgi:hypothetical protein
MINEALQLVANEIDKIINPPAGNVVPLRRGEASAADTR